MDEFHNAVVDGELDEWIKHYYGGQIPVLTLAELGEDDKGKDSSETIRNNDGDIIAVIVRLAKTG